MRKITYLLMVLAVAFIAVSCEKEPLRQPTDCPGQDEVVPGEDEVVSGEDEVALKQLYGFWTRTIESEDTITNMEWRFYEDGYSLRMRESYEGDRLLSLSRGRYDYKFEDGKFYVKEYHDDEWTAWDYTILEDSLTLSRESDGGSIVWTFVRTVDADARLVGCWDAPYENGNGGRVEHHYKFHTPTYGNVYDVVYDDSGSSKVNFLYDFRYRIEGDKIVFNRYTNTGYALPEYSVTYRLAGTKLYLSEGNGGETMYSNFYKENNIPFRP